MFIRLLGIVTALATGVLLLAYPFMSESARGWVLYYAVCSLAATMAVVGLMVANSLEGIVNVLRRMQPPRDRGGPRVPGSPGGEG